MKKPEMVLFDLDGTILNTLEDIADSVNHCLQCYGFPEVTMDEVRANLGSGAQKLIGGVVPPDTDAEVVQRLLGQYVPYYESHSCIKTCPFEGIPQVISELRGQGIRTAVVSNKPDAATRKIISFYFDGCFDAVIGQQAGLPRKPQPDMALTVLERFFVAPRDAVYVGDTEIDYQTAQNGGMRPILVSWGFRSRERLVDTGAKEIADTSAQLRTLLLD